MTSQPRLLSGLVLSGLILTGLTAVGLAGINSATGAELTNGLVAAPCNATSGPAFLRKCQDVIAGVPGQSGYTGPSGILSNLDDTVKKLVDDPVHSLYRGEVVDQSSPPDQPQSFPFGRPVCDVVPSPFNGSRPELATNHNGDKCGLPTYFTVHASKSGVHTTMDMNKPNGIMEASYTRGAWIQAVTCYWQQVRNEIQQTHNLKVSSSCEALGKNVADLGRNSEVVANQIKSGLGRQANISDIESCLKSKSSGMGSNGAQDPGALRQSAQQLCSARAGTEALFNQLAVCEVFSRAGKAYRGVISDPETFLDEIRDKVAGSCNDRCSSQCGGCGSTGECERCGTTCANSCYTDELRRFFQTKLKNWPSDGSCR